MNSTRSMTMFQRLGLACLSAVLAMPSSALTSSFGNITSVNPSSLDANPSTGVNRQIDQGEAANAEQRQTHEISRQQDATPTPEAAATVQPSLGSIAPSSLESDSAAATGNVIRRRVFAALATGAAIAACLLLLLWAYVTFGDPVRRHRASVRMRQLRREERRSRRRRG